MAKCYKCGNSGLFLKLNALGLCSDCEISELKAKNREQDQKIYQLTQRIAELKDRQQQMVKNQNVDLKKETAPSKTIENNDLDKIILDCSYYRNKLAMIKSAYESKRLWTEDDVKSMHNIFYDPQYMELNYKAVNVPTLKKIFKQTLKQIRENYNYYISAHDDNNSQKAIFELSQLLAESKFDNALKSMRYGKLSESVKNLEADLETVKRLAIKADQNLSNTVSWCIGKAKALYIDALNTEYAYYTEQQRIKEEQQAIKEQMRQEAEERKALERERKRVEKEEAKYTNEINSLNSQLNDADEATAKKLQERIAQLEHQLEEMHEKKEQILTLENGKAGYVYVISNIGSFGDNIYKIGMTRRLEPMERINELSNASVPFPFDVHSFIFSNDAVTLEHNIHISLNERRVNKINMRKEFFNISIDELETMVSELCPTAEFKRTALAIQYRQSSDFIDNSNKL